MVAMFQDVKCINSNGGLESTRTLGIPPSPVTAVQRIVTGKPARWMSAWSTRNQALVAVGAAVSTIALRHPRRSRDVCPSATTAITLTTRKPLPINTDGELTTYTPAEFSIRPKALQVYSPQR